MEVKSTWVPFLHGIEWIMYHAHLDYFEKPPLGGRLNTKPGDHGTPNAHNHWLTLLYHDWGPAWIEIHWKSIWLRALVTYDFTLHLRIHDHTTWFWWCVGTAFGYTLSFGLSQFHGHSSWLSCEVTLGPMLMTTLEWTCNIGCHLLTFYWLSLTYALKLGDAFPHHLISFQVLIHYSYLLWMNLSKLF